MLAMAQWLFRHFHLLLAAQLGVAALLATAAVALLRQKAWARSTLEVLCWLGIVVFLAWNAVFLHSWLSMTATIPEEPGAPSPAMMAVFGVVSTLFGALFYCGILGGLLWMLRHRTVREAVQG